MGVANVFNMAWLPQTDLLRKFFIWEEKIMNFSDDLRVVAFISHMGLNSFTETSFAGVPVVAVPMFTDQVVRHLFGFSFFLILWVVAHAVVLMNFALVP